MTTTVIVIVDELFIKRMLVETSERTNKMNPIIREAISSSFLK